MKAELQDTLKSACKHSTIVMRMAHEKAPAVGNAGAAAEGGAASGGRASETIEIENEIGEKGEGTFSKVMTCRLTDGRLAAVKRMKSQFRSWEQVNSLREVQALRRLNPHPNIIDLYAVQ